MKDKKISLGGKLSLAHFILFFLLWMAALMISQPDASISDPDHWYWAYSDLIDTWLIIISLPLAWVLLELMSHGSIVEFYMFILVSFANSYLIGHCLAGLIRIVSKPPSKQWTSRDD